MEQAEDLTAAHPVSAGIPLHSPLRDTEPPWHDLEGSWCIITRRSYELAEHAEPLARLRAEELLVLTFILLSPGGCARSF